MKNALLLCFVVLHASSVQAQTDAGSDSQGLDDASALGAATDVDLAADNTTGDELNKALVAKQRAKKEASEVAANLVLEKQLRDTFSHIERFTNVEATVAHGVVRLSGRVPSTEAEEQAIELAKSFDGVVYVDNALKSPISVSERIDPLKERVEGFGGTFLRYAPLVFFAFLIFLLFWMLGRWISHRETLLEKAIPNPMLREIVGRLIRFSAFLLGVVAALEVLDATAVVGTVLGAAGVAGIAIGFAFQGIVENYIASFLLISRRPFSIGDAIKLDDLDGVVMGLTMRETVLMTWDGNHLSVPNASVFKATVLNYSRNPKRRLDFYVDISAEANVSDAKKIATHALEESPGVIVDPAPRGEIQELKGAMVSIRFFAWVDQRKADFFKVRSEAVRRVKVALENRGITIPEPTYRINLQDLAIVKPSDQVKAHEIEYEKDVDIVPDASIEDQIKEQSNEQENLIRGEAPNSTKKETAEQSEPQTARKTADAAKTS